MKLTQTIYSYRALILSSLVVFGLFVLPLTVFATTTPATTVGEASGLKLMLYSLVVNVFGSLLGVAGLLLDFAIDYYVIGFGESFLRGGVGEAVDILWVTVRDFFNVMFIFGLVYIGFKMILNSDDAGTKRNLVYLIMAALLINFSLFITKFVVDFTNILASEIVLAGFPEIDETTGGTVIGEVDMANRFFSYMGIQETLNAPRELLINEETPYFFIFGNAILYVIAAFVFASGAIMLIIRFVALSIYMVLSPFMFVGWVFPGFQNTTRKYWTGFLGRAFYAPVYVILLYFAGAILSRLYGSGGSVDGPTLGQQIGGEASGVAGFAAVLGPFVLSSAFLIAAVQVAGKLSADGAGTAMKVGSQLTNRARRGVRGVGRFGARHTAGFVAQGVSSGAEIDRSNLNRRLARMGQSKNGFVRATARGIDRTVGAGLDRAANASVAGSETAKQQRDRIRSQQNSFNDTNSAIDRKQKIKEGRKELADANLIIDDEFQVEADREKARKEKDAAETKIRAAVQKMTDKELLNLSQKELESPEIAGFLSDAQKKTLAGSGNLTGPQIKDLGDNRENAMFAGVEKILNSTESSNKELQTAMESLSKSISGLSGDSLTGLSFNRMNTEAVASQLSEKQMETIKESGKLSGAEYDELTETRNTGIANILNKGRIDVQEKDGKGKVIKTTPTTVTGDGAEKFVKEQRDKFVKTKAETVGKLPIEAFLQGDQLTKAGEQITVDELKAIARASSQGKGNMTAEDRENLAKAVIGSANYNSRIATYLKSNKGREEFSIENVKEAA